MSDYSGILFARPSFVEGAARLVDVGGTLNEYNASRSAEDADQNALAADWRQVGAEILEAAKKRRQIVRESGG